MTHAHGAKPRACGREPRCTSWPGCGRSAKLRRKMPGRSCLAQQLRLPSPRRGSGLSTQKTLPAPVAVPHPVKALWAPPPHLALPCATPRMPLACQTRPQLQRQSHCGSFPRSPGVYCSGNRAVPPGVITSPARQVARRSAHCDSRSCARAARRPGVEVGTLVRPPCGCCGPASPAGNGAWATHLRGHRRGHH